MGYIAIKKKKEKGKRKRERSTTIRTLDHKYNTVAR